MKSLSRAAFNYGFSEQRQAPKKYRHNDNLKAKDDFIKNASNGLKLRKANK